MGAIFRGMTYGIKPCEIKVVPNRRKFIVKVGDIVRFPYIDMDHSVSYVARKDEGKFVKIRFGRVISISTYTFMVECIDRAYKEKISLRKVDYELGTVEIYKEGDS